MNKSSVLYERNIHTSYMKVPALSEDCLDVRIMLHRTIKGMIPVEQCFMNGQGQYWYNISGKQALDSFAKMQMLEYSFFEMLILKICEQLELLEWNLLDGNGLLVDPEFIFMNNKGEDIMFVFYPESDRNILKELQKLLEYLLTKLNHTNQEEVQGAYALYEMTLNETYQVQDLRDFILERRIKKKRELPITDTAYEYQNIQMECSRVAENDCIYGNEVPEEDVKENSFQNQMEEKWAVFCKKAKSVFIRKAKKEIPMVVYPKEEEEVQRTTVHPTICITVASEKPRGILVYEGREDYPDFELDESICVIGKSHRARMQIEKDTVSHFHAKIEYADGYYIEDMNSTNGTFVNDEIVNYKERRLLCSGDMIRFADIKYRFL